MDPAFVEPSIEDKLKLVKMSRACCFAKPLDRYFHFDEKDKKLVYYENEKKEGKPKKSVALLESTKVTIEMKGGLNASFKTIEESKLT